MIRTAITIIGAGNMGEGIAAALITAAVVPPRSITMIDRRKSRLNELKKKYGVNTSDNLTTSVANANIVLIAVKPQDASVLCSSIRGIAPTQAMVISIMAGVQIATLQHALNHKRVIRAMPNTPAIIRQGMTVWKAASAVTGAQKNMARKIFAATGEEFEIQTEKMIDAATAVSGSGPAYVFAFVEYITDAARDLGFTTEQADRLVQQTLKGGAALLASSKDDAATLREKVTSKKGTTDAALKVLKKEKVASAYKRAIQAAYKRARELSQKK